MNTVIANQYGRVQGEAGSCGLTLCVTAQTPRRESVHLETCVDCVAQQLHLLAILRAVERRIEQFQLREGKAGESAEQQSPFDETICGEEDLFRSNGSPSKNKIYGRFSQFLVYEAGGTEPAYRKPGATLVDLRMFDPDDRSANPRLVFRPEKLRELGIPGALIEAAAKSDPQDSFYSMTCRIRRSQQPAMPTKTN